MAGASPLVLLEPDAAAVQNLVASLGVDELIGRLLVNRGVSRPDAAKAFLHPALRDLPDPALMADATAAAACIAAAMARQDPICVYGDYDADGVSAAALLHDFFALAGYPVTIFLPDRFRDGYGLHLGRLEELADQGIRLFVAVDCGSTSVREVAAMRARGCEFVVCDHHTLGTELPPASALLNPKRVDCTYPDKHLSAVGVALVLAQALRRELDRQGWQAPGGRLELRDLLEFTALGTIADMVPLRGVNRTLAWHGLRLLGQSRRAGIRALADQAGPDLGIAADRVGFQLAPRLNAAGRMADARTAFDLLTTTCKDSARSLAGQIELENNRRKTLQAEVARAALAQAELLPERHDAVVVADPAWHPGVVGIVAARVKDQLGVPTFVLGIDEDGMARGSGRSVPGYDLVEGLHACCADGLAERFGGHAFAAGITLRADRVPELRRRLARHVASVLPAENRVTEMVVDGELDVRQIDLELVQRLELLEPYGKDNRRPQFLLRGVEVQAAKTVGDGSWMRCNLLAPGRAAAWARPSVAAFGALASFGEARSGDRVDAVVRIERNVHRGLASVQASVERLLPAGARIVARPIEA